MARWIDADLLLSTIGNCRIDLGDCIVTVREVVEQMAQTEEDDEHDKH